MADTSEFLNPKSMVTPGVAGGLTMLITNALAKQFDLPGNWTSLMVSFLFGLLVFGAALSIAQRLVFYVINSLIIFSVAVGANSAGQQLQQPQAKTVLMPVSKIMKPLTTTDTQPRMPTTFQTTLSSQSGTPEKFFGQWFAREDHVMVEVVPSARSRATKSPVM
jgi:hypothetical protein